VTGSDDNRNKMATHLPAPADDDLPDVVTELLRADVLRTAGVGGDAELAEALQQLQSLGHGPLPLPSAELAALLGPGAAVVPSAGRRRSRRRKAVLGGVLTGAMTLGLTGVAAANDKLPGPAQRAVSDVVDTLTPFTIDSRPKSPPRPSGPVHQTAPPTPAGHLSAPTQVAPGSVPRTGEPGADPGSAPPSEAARPGAAAPDAGEPGAADQGEPVLGSRPAGTDPVASDPGGWAEPGSTAAAGNGSADSGGHAPATGESESPEPQRSEPGG
jgi:hypothetical protein